MTLGSEPMMAGGVLTFRQNCLIIHVIKLSLIWLRRFIAEVPCRFLFTMSFAAMLRDSIQRP